MTQFTTHLGRTARRLTLLAAPLLVGATGTAAAHGGSWGGMGGLGGFGMLGGGMLLWPLLLIGLVLLLVYGADRGNRTDNADSPLEELRTAYARGDLTDEEFETRRDKLERSE